MGPRTIRTNAGHLDLIPVTIEDLRGVTRCWPMELIANPDTADHFGIVFQRGDEEVYGVKMQPPDVAEADARVAFHMNRALLATALPSYLEKQHRGVMVPCAYYKEKSEGMVETGIAFFVGPDAPRNPSSADDTDLLYDERLGDGATSIVFDTAGALVEASKKCGLPLMTVIGMDLCPGLSVGSLAMDFVIEGSDVFAVQDPLQMEDPVWEYVVRAGFSTLPYAPMTPVSLPGAPPTSRSA